MSVAQSSPPAKGPPVTDLIWASLVAIVLSGVVLWIAMAHRDGRIQWLRRLAAFSERVSGLPGWAALPAAITGASLLVAAFGFYWDVAKHIDTGRDPSPFGTPAHYPILVGPDSQLTVTVVHHSIQYEYFPLPVHRVVPRPVLTALYLLSDLSGGVTGEIHYVDSGYNIVLMPKPDDLKSSEQD